MTEIITLFVTFLCIFLFGMTVLRVGLYQLSYKKMRDVLSLFADTPLKGMISGTVVTAILQSSSTTMVLTIGFVSIGFLTFRQSIGIILGANIGTTLTVEMMSYSDLLPLWPFVVFGAILLLIPNQKIFGIGGIIFGLSSIFVALEGFKTLTEPLSNIPALEEAFIFTNLFPSIGIIIGTIITAIIQSSSATTGIVMSILQEGLLFLPASIAIMIGSNLGTCMTAFLAAVVGNREAKLVAMAHIWLNLFGVILFAPFIQDLASLGYLLSDHPGRQLAHISVLFNVISSLAILPFVSYFTKFILFVHDRKEIKIT